MYFEWKDEYSVNVAEIDKQHRRLFEIGARLYDLAGAKETAADMTKVLKSWTAEQMKYPE